MCISFFQHDLVSTQTEVLGGRVAELTCKSLILADKNNTKVLERFPRVCNTVTNNLAVRASRYGLIYGPLDFVSFVNLLACQ